VFAYLGSVIRADNSTWTLCRKPGSWLVPPVITIDWDSGTRMSMGHWNEMTGVNYTPKTQLTGMEVFIIPVQSKVKMMLIKGQCQHD